MSLKDFLPKKGKVTEIPTEDKQKFFADFEVFQKEHGMRLGAAIIHNLKGSHVEFTLIWHEDNAPAK